MAQNLKNLEYSVLMDFYAPVLTQKQRDILHQYYDQDLSLAEIAANFGITRQGVRDAIKHGEVILTDMEAKIGSARRYAALQAELDKLERYTKDIRCVNQGLCAPSRRIQEDTTEILRILQGINAAEEGENGI
ncbi:MAG: sigma factor-like helix-turn-helix DNA-binding protein [Gemmiger sp.]|nr:sigma factor-like helix-turn-helix DNA-binding protein [Gemmiger sp.]